MKKKILYLVIIIITTIQSAHSKHNAETLNKENLFLVSKKNSYPNEISWCIADLKFDGTSVKVCEFGEGRYSMFKGYDALYGQGKLWEMFWNFLGTFNLPVWFVNIRPQACEFKDQARHILTRVGGKRVSTINGLDTPSKIVDKSGAHFHNKTDLVVLDSLAWPQEQCNIFCSKHPEILALGQATNYFVRTKLATNQLFQDTDVRDYKPKFKIYPKKYTSTLARTIINDLAPHTIFVIKPIKASCGYGIILVETQGLDNTLNLILTQQGKLKQSFSDKSYTYWASDTQKEFIVEAYAPSKPISANNKLYDATMRVVFSLFNDNGTMGMYFFGAYWKLPPKAINEQGSLNDKHKSHIVSKGKSSAPVDPADFAIVKRELSVFLPVLYEKMLSQLSN